jgi:hypothetical protein
MSAKRLDDPTRRTKMTAELDVSIATRFGPVCVTAAGVLVTRPLRINYVARYRVTIQPHP